MTETLELKAKKTEDRRCLECGRDIPLGNAYHTAEGYVCLTGTCLGEYLDRTETPEMVEQR